jgi:hypothetical protein
VTKSHNKRAARPKKTYTGRVVYNHARKRYFTGRDLTRVVTHVNNNALAGLTTASYANWKYVQRLSSAWVLAAERTWKAKERETIIEGDYDKILDKLYWLGDTIHRYVVPLLEDVPLAGVILQIVDSIYTGVRGYFDSEQYRSDNSLVEILDRGAIEDGQ